MKILSTVLLLGAFGCSAIYATSDKEVENKKNIPPLYHNLPKRPRRKKFSLGSVKPEKEENRTINIEATNKPKKPKTQEIGVQANDEEIAKLQKELKYWRKQAAILRHAAFSAADAIAFYQKFVGGFEGQYDMKDIDIIYQNHKKNAPKLVVVKKSDYQFLLDTSLNKKVQDTNESLGNALNAMNKISSKIDELQEIEKAKLEGTEWSILKSVTGFFENFVSSKKDEKS